MKMDVKEKENVHIYTKKLLSQEDSVKIKLGTEVSKEARVEKEVKKEERTTEKGWEVKIEVKKGVIEEKEMTEETQEAEEKAKPFGDQRNARSQTNAKPRITNQKAKY